MKQFDIIKAYKTLETLADNKNFNGKEQWDLYNLRKELRSHAEFQEEREKALYDKYISFADDKGQISGKPYADYLKDLEELNSMEIELDIDKLSIRFVDGMSFKDAEPLEDFIEFTMPE
jgi:hypothetical protein